MHTDRRVISYSGWERPLLVYYSGWECPHAKTIGKMVLGMSAPGPSLLQSKITDDSSFTTPKGEK
jgi:hypothetical protein